MNQGFASFEEFWPFYVREHAHPGNRLMHVLGTGMALALSAGIFASGRLSLAWLVPMLGYGCAWVGHFALENNRPATFKHPLWSIRADFAMFRLILSGRMNQELARHLPPTDDKARSLVAD